MNKDKTKLIIKEKNMYKAFIVLALPVMGANFLKALHDIVDTYFVGQMPNSASAQAGMSIAWPLINILMSFNTGLAVAGVAVISQLLGAGNKEIARKYSGLLFSATFCMGIIINILMYISAPVVMKLMGAEGDVYDCAVAYLQIRSFEMVFTLMFTAFQSIRQANGDTVTPVILSVISVVVNIIFTSVFVQGMSMGVKGAAYATVFAQAVIAPAIIYGLFLKKNEMKLDLASLKVDWTSMKKLLKIATPSAGSQALSSLGFLILQSVILDYGKEVSAAFSIGNKISNLLLIVVSALSTVLAAFVGQNIGAHNKERAKRSYVVSRNVALIFTFVGVVILFPIREYAVRLLTNNEETIKVGLEYVFWVLMTQPMMSLFQNYLGLFNGSGNTKISLIMSSVRLWILRLPMILIFKNFTDFGRNGIWYAMVISNILIVILGHFLMKKVDYEPKVRQE